MDYEGVFEGHITVSARKDEIKSLQSYAAECSLKMVLIELDKGENIVQPMINVFHKGTLPGIVEKLTDRTDHMVKAGFNVVRMKVEAGINNANVPRNSLEAKTRNPGNYFEFHAKVRFPSDAKVESLKEIAIRHGSHFSSNALKTFPDYSERFLTMRCFKKGRIESLTTLFDMLVALKRAEFEVINTIKEYTVFDTNAKLDFGWIACPECDHCPFKETE